MRCIPHVFFFFNDTATTEIYTLSLHDALPISELALDDQALADNLGRAGHDFKVQSLQVGFQEVQPCQALAAQQGRDRKSTRLNSSHQIISYAVFCLKKKNVASVGQAARATTED